jgi:hypothetical protein
VLKKKLFTQAAKLGRIFLFLEHKEKSREAVMGGGARSALFGVAMSSKIRMRAAHGRARAAKTH